MGYSVPDDIAVVGFTSGLISDMTNPTLTSIEQHGYLIGKEAVGLLIERIEKRHDLPSQTKIIKTELVIKGSTSRIPVQRSQEIKNEPLPEILFFLPEIPDL